MADAPLAAGVGRRLPGTLPLLAGQVGYQFRLLLATPSALAIGVGLPVVLLIVSNAKSGGDGPAKVAGYAVLGLTMAAWNTHGVRLVAARELGILRRWRAAPLPRWCYFAGRIVATSLFATLAALVTLLAGVLFAGITLSAAAALAALPVLVAGALAWSAASTAMSSVVPNTGAASPAFLLTYFPVILVSGALGPISGLPHWLATVASYLPAEPVIDTVGRALGHGPVFSARDLLVLAAWVVGGLAVASARFRWEPYRPAQHRAGRERASSRDGRDSGNRTLPAYLGPVTIDSPPGTAGSFAPSKEQRNLRTGEAPNAGKIRLVRQADDGGRERGGDARDRGGRLLVRRADDAAAGYLRLGHYALPRRRHAVPVRGQRLARLLRNGRAALPGRQPRRHRDGHGHRDRLRIHRTAGRTGLPGDRAESGVQRELRRVAGHDQHH